MASELVDPVRAFLYELFHHGLNEDNFVALKKVLVNEGYTLQAELVKVNSQSRTEILKLIITSTTKRSSKDYFGLFKKLFSAIDRQDLVMRCERFEENRNGSFFRISSLVAIIFRLAANRKLFFMCILSVLVPIASIILSYHKVWMVYRYYKCTWDGDQQSLMSFTFTTYDMVDADVEYNVEFEWQVLSKKLRLDFPAHSLPSRYFLNTNRCILGEVRVQHRMDNIKAVRGGEIFAVSLDCKQVFYHSNSKWVRYKSARNISCTKTVDASKIHGQTTDFVNMEPSKDDH